MLSKIEKISEVVSGKKTGHTWLNDFRAQALDQYRKTGFPTANQELWRFSTVQQLEHIPFQPDFSAPDTTDKKYAENFLKTLKEKNFYSSGHRFVFLNGHFLPELSNVNAKSSGYSFNVIDADELLHHPDLQQILSAPFSRPGAFKFLNDALFQKLVSVRVAKNAIVERPIEILFLSSKKTPLLYSPKILLTLEDGAQASVVQHYRADSDAQNMTNAVAQICLGKNAVLYHIKYQQESWQGYHTAQTEVAQPTDSQFFSSVVSTGAKFSREDLNVVLNGAGAACTLNGIYYLQGNQQADHHTLIDHASGHGSSRELYKGVMDGTAQAIFDGKVIVRPQAQKTDAIQINKNLLLTKGARINTKPDLEIFANDVKCKHGATIGQLQKEALFYLQSRGIALAEARQILIRAFVSEIADAIAQEPLRLQMKNFLEQLGYV